jgi:hypothetical protein
MIPLSARNALPVIVVMFLLAIPIGYHALLRPRVDDCSNPARLQEPNLLPLSTRDNDPSRKPHVYTAEGGQGVLRIDRPWKIRPRWEIGRSYDLSGFYFGPPGFFSHFFPGGTVRMPARDASGAELPIHTIVDDSEGFRHFAAYLYVFAGRPVRHPVIASLRHAIPQIIRGALPLNMILVEGGSAFEHAEENEEILLDWMRSAWLEFDEVCGS